MRTNGDAGNAGWVIEGLAALNARGGAAEEDGTTKVAIAVVRGSRSSVILRHSIRAFFQATSVDNRHVFGNAAGFTHNRRVSNRGAAPHLDQPAVVRKPGRIRPLNNASVSDVLPASAISFRDTSRQFVTILGVHIRCRPLRAFL